MPLNLDGGCLNINTAKTNPELPPLNTKPGSNILRRATTSIRHVPKRAKAVLNIQHYTTNGQVGHQQIQDRGLPTLNTTELLVYTEKTTWSSILNFDPPLYSILRPKTGLPSLAYPVQQQT